MFAGKRQQHINLAFERVQMPLRYGSANVTHMQEAQAADFKMIQGVGIRVTAIFRLVVKRQAFRRRKGSDLEPLHGATLRRQVKGVHHFGIAQNVTWVRMKLIGGRAHQNDVRRFVDWIKF